MSAMVASSSENEAVAGGAGAHPAETVATAEISAAAPGLASIVTARLGSCYGDVSVSAAARATASSSYSASFR